MEEAVPSTESSENDALSAARVGQRTALGTGLSADARPFRAPQWPVASATLLRADQILALRRPPPIDHPARWQPKDQRQPPTNCSNGAHLAALQRPRAPPNASQPASQPVGSKLSSWPHNGAERHACATGNRPFRPACERPPWTGAGPPRLQHRMGAARGPCWGLSVAAALAVQGASLRQKMAITCAIIIILPLFYRSQLASRPTFATAWKEREKQKQTSRNNACKEHLPQTGCGPVC